MTISNFNARIVLEKIIISENCSMEYNALKETLEKWHIVQIMEDNFKVLKNISQSAV